MNKLIIEGILYDKDTDAFDINFKHDTDKDVVKLTYASKLVVKQSKFYSIQIYYAYNLNVKHIEKPIREKLIDLFKYQTGISEQDYEHLLNKAVLKFNNVQPITEFDMIIAPKSKSSLLKQLLSKLKAKSGNTILANDVLIKNAIENVYVDYDKYISTAKDEKEKQKRLKDLKGQLKGATKEGEFKVKSIYPQFRKFFSNYLIFKSDTSRTIYNAISNGNILIVDDIKTSGETLKEMLREVNTYVPKSVTIFIFFRNE